MTNLTLNPLFLKAATKLLQEEFTVDRLTEAYLALDDCAHHKKKPARQFIYRNMCRLMKNGELDKLVGNSNWPSYKFTKKFQEHLVPPSQLTSMKTHEKSQISREREIKTQLRERLNVLKLEMLTAMGEVEEYNSLELEIPSIKTSAQKLADESRDRCSKLLGKVKAIETLLNA